MPEGDTLFRSARTLSRALAGRTITRVLSPLEAIARAELVGRRVERVEAHGKNLVMHFDDGRALHSHMMMNGSWHLYRAGERWRKPEHMARVAFEVAATADDIARVAVCFLAPVVRLIGDADLDPKLESLGPDILSPSFDREEAIRRLHALGSMPTGVAIVHQGALAGIGNIYKSESLFACKVDPFAPIASLDHDRLAALIDRARRMMHRNTGRGGAMRVTTMRHFHGSPFAVYERSGAPCFTCGTTIRMKRQGTQHRSTYFCPQCQGCAET